MKDLKLHVFYRRVSTKGQELDTQIEFDRPYRDLLQEEEIYIIEEHGLSALKLTIKERPKMQELIKLVEENKVSTVYLYDRTRSFRNYYEAMLFIDLCKKHGTNIIYTSSANGHLDYSNDLLVEGILNIFGEMEGKNITRRTQESYRRYPPKKFGFVKNKETKTYTQHEEMKVLLKKFFADLHEVQNFDEMKGFILFYRKALKIDDEKVIKIATDPFYAGMDLYVREFDLPHVDSYLTKEDYYEIQKRIKPLVINYANDLAELKMEFGKMPRCGICSRSLKLKVNPDRTQSSFSCVSSHKKQRVSWTMDELVETLDIVVNDAIVHLDSERLVKDSKKQMRLIESEIKKELKRLDVMMDELQEELLFSNELNSDWTQLPQYQALMELRSQYGQLQQRMMDKQRILMENKYLDELVKNALKDQALINVNLLKDLLIDEIYLFENSIHVKLYKFDYLKGMDKEIYLNEGEKSCS